MSKLVDYSGRTNRSVAVFCWSRTEPGTPLWDQAETLGRLVATHGFTAVTGGYCGSMEAVSKGARTIIDAEKAAGKNTTSEVVGVTVSGIFPDRVREGNPYLTVTKDSQSMLDRVEQLQSQSRYFIILPGTLGTLQELSCIWVQKLLYPAGAPRPVIICFRDPWEKCLKGIAEALQLPQDQLDLITFVDTPEEAMRIVVDDDAQQRQQQGSL